MRAVGVRFSLSEVHPWLFACLQGLHRSGGLGSKESRRVSQSKEGWPMVLSRLASGASKGRYGRAVGSSWSGAEGAKLLRQRLHP